MAVKSIIDIEVNDEQFKRFQSLFEKYQAQLGDMPKGWSQTAKAADEAAGSFSDMTAALLAQAELLHQHNADLARAEKTERRAAQAQKDKNEAAKKFEAQRAKSAKDADERTKSIAKNVAHATADLLKWTAITGVFSGLLGAGGFFGLDRLAANVGDARRSAQGLGVSIGEQRGFSTNFGRYVDANANLENIAQAQNDWSKRWAFQAMGVNQQGKDPAALAVEMALRAKQIFDSGDQSEQSAQAHGLLQFYTMDELRRLHATSMKDLQASASDFRRDKGLFALEDQTSKGWQDFSIQMHRAGLQIESVFVKGLTPLIPQLTQLSGAFAKAVGDFLANPHLKEWITELGDNIQKFSTWIGSDDFKTKVNGFIDSVDKFAKATGPGFLNDVDVFAKNVGTLAKAMVDALVWLKLIPDPNAKPIFDAMPTLPGHDPGRYISGNEAMGAWWEDFTHPGGKQTRQAAPKMLPFMQDMIGFGLSPERAAGAVANMWQESSGNIHAENKGHYGLFQWDATRQAAFKQWFGKDIRDPSVTAKDQERFFLYELAHSHKAAGAALAGAGNARDAAIALDTAYEKPARPGSMEDRAEQLHRGQSAMVLMDAYNKTKSERAEILAIADSLRHAKGGTLTQLLTSFEGAKSPKNLTAEIQGVANETGFKADQAINTGDSNVVAKLVAAIENQRHKGGGFGDKAVITVMNNTGGSAVVSTNQVAH